MSRFMSHKLSLLAETFDVITLNFAESQLQPGVTVPEPMTRMPPVGPEDAAPQSAQLGLRSH